MERIEYHASFDGWQEVYQHQSRTLDCKMKFGIYIPPQALDRKVPVLYWLSGLTCTEQNFITKSGAQKYAAEHGIIIVTPDTSPRGDKIPDDNHYALGQGAGFYINATQEPWKHNYKMYDYIVNELPEIIESHFPASDKRSISGHSMGGHGALTIALKNPGRYQSVSAFSPVVAPSQAPWGKNAFSNYLGNDTESWKEYDAVELIQSAKDKLPLLIEQGLNDEFLEEQLQPNKLLSVCEKHNYPITLNLREGHDHSYYFIGSYIGSHISYHAKYLNA